MASRVVMLGLSLLIATACIRGAVAVEDGTAWTREQVAVIRSLSLARLEPLATDPSNRFADDAKAAALGKQLFFDTRLSANGKVSCASCHDPARGFQDGIPLSHGVGTMARRAMPIAGTAHSPWMFWDGRKDSQWSQALGPLESSVEHGGSRAQKAHVIANAYRAEYVSIFGPLPDLNAIPRTGGPVDDPAAHNAWNSLSQQQRDDVTRVYVNIGKAIAAFERTVQHERTRFDDYADALTDDGHEDAHAFSPEEIQGLRIFIGRGNCTQCHNGARLTDNSFHNTGIPAVPGVSPDRGRTDGARNVLADEFNCRSSWSDAKAGDCTELEFLNADGPELEGAMKTPSLRDVAGRAPYMHAGQIRTLEDAVDHYNRAPRSAIGHTEIHPLKLNVNERAAVVAYLRTLSAKSPVTTRGN
jgi:cytochrome c peroxidase